ncbi:hypothetical protein KCP74_21705 [Salmonella enterica subsp. enterica]|nr:hypothetical protein KCP74_21705 [Salmonella enterica subsp. enterica]
MIEIHQGLVGVSNHRTLEDSRSIYQRKCEGLDRCVVVVPGWMPDDDDSAHHWARLPAIWVMSKIELLPYRPSWARKHK